jgi:phytoene synthase
MRLDTAYATCETITRHEARNFSYGIRLLPPARRRAMSAVYAMARRIDDIGDGDQPAEVRSLALDGVADQLRHLDRPEDEDPVLMALADAARTLPLPLDAFGDLIEGCRSDVEGRQYGDFDEVVGYCRLVAGSIGRLSVGVYAPPDLVRAMPLADSLGVALQLTNILRDLREDRALGRVYLPQDDLDRFGCTLQLDADGRIADPPERFSALVRFQAARAQRWYDDGLALLGLLDRRAAACTAAMAGIYRRLLQAIAAEPDRVRFERVAVPAPVKLAVAGRALLRRTA